MPRKLLLSFVLFCCVCLNTNAQKNPFLFPAASAQKWVDSIYNKLTPDERIGQLFMVAAYSGGKNFNEEAITQLIDRHQIGGLIFMQGGPVRQALLTNKYQSRAQVPLLLAMDAEWGLGMRLDSVISFPRQMMLGASRDTSLMYQIAMAIAYQFKRIGAQVNFAPVVDINNNPENPVINSRSFGEDKTEVTRMAMAYMKGLQENGVMACLKHFPGHGNTDVDSHKDLPVIRQTKDQLEETELYPFRQLISGGVHSVMVAHLNVPSLEATPKLPTTLSYNTITNLLKNDLRFRGLTFTDALNMDGVAKYFQPGDLELKAFQAGNDVLLFSQNVPVSIAKLRQALDAGKISTQELEKRVKKILLAKYVYGLNKWKPVNTANLTADLNQYTLTLKTESAEAAVTLVQDNNRMLNALEKSGCKVQYIGLNGSANGTVLERQLNKSFPGMASRMLGSGSTTADFLGAQNSLDAFDVNIVALHNVSLYPAKNYGIDAVSLNFISKIQRHPKTIFVLLGNAYALKLFCNMQSMLVMYESDTTTELAAAEVLSRNIPPAGRLPVTPCLGMPKGIINSGENVFPYRLNKTDQPRSSGTPDNNALQKINSFMNRCVNERVFPGARVMALQNGKVIFDQSYGYLDYQKTEAVTANTIYDVASLTKILSTTLAVMKLYEEGKIGLDQRLKDFLPWVKGTDEENLSIRNLLLHQAGLKSWIPFYKETVDASTGMLKQDLYRSAADDSFDIPVAAGLFLRNDYRDTIWQRILTQPLEIIGKYNYSDLDFYFLQKVVEAVSKKSLNAYVQTRFYNPMGLKNIGYNPLRKFPLEQIAPTENDLSFRHQLIRGYVHDPGAAMFGGVAGHAGIFATAADVAAVFQMLMDNGTYRGKEYFKAATVQKFIRYNSTASRRGLGFDKPSNERNDGGPCGNRCSGSTFGHQGFTGTCAWADPANGIVFVFLSNRVNPNAENNGINRLSVRTVVQDYIYEGLGIPENKNRPDIYQTDMTELR
ncbi:glycoside hydrolase family 3 N-terminal domain-containing protein [Rurimicrobium arvi]|uniref:beta-N-acetylhexosaminidase n=1 Tax=Rurimicrobium arvi TaxID=2049916 RepID=A0ABP8MKS7_9BACT